MYRPVTPYPAVLRDLAVVVPVDIPSRQMEETIRSAGKDLASADLFDLYEGKGIPDGHRSLAWSLSFQSPNRTLTDEEVDESIQAIVGALDREYGARLR